MFAEDRDAVFDEDGARSAALPAAAQRRTGFYSEGCPAAGRKAVYAAACGEPIRSPVPPLPCKPAALAEQRRSAGASRRKDRRHRGAARRGIDGNSWTPPAARPERLPLPDRGRSRRTPAQRPVKIRLGETGPLVASLIIESEARAATSSRAKCGWRRRRLRRDHQLVDKKRLDAASYMPGGQGERQFLVPIPCPDGEIRLDVPFGVIRPDADQIASACKNWFTVGRWADVANADFGVTWVTLDAPLVQVVAHGHPAQLPDQPRYLAQAGRAHPEARLLGDEQPLGHQLPRLPGRAYGLSFHPAAARGPTDPAEATRFATGFSQPLLVTGTGAQHLVRSRC